MLESASEPFYFVDVESMATGNSNRRGINMSWLNKKSNGVLVCGACAVMVNEKSGDSASTDRIAKAVKRFFS